MSKAEGPPAQSGDHVISKPDRPKGLASAPRGRADAGPSERQAPRPKAPERRAETM
jgi:hypothetical protein